MCRRFANLFNAWGKGKTTGAHACFCVHLFGTLFSLSAPHPHTGIPPPVFSVELQWLLQAAGLHGLRGTGAFPSRLELLSHKGWLSPLSLTTWQPTCLIHYSIHRACENANTQHPALLNQYIHDRQSQTAETTRNLLGSRVHQNTSCKGRALTDGLLKTCSINTVHIPVFSISILAEGPWCIRIYKFIKTQI